MNNDDSLWVNRGGGWNSNARYARVAYRIRDLTSVRNGGLGFRLSRVVNPLEQLTEVLNDQ